MTTRPAFEPGADPSAALLRRWQEDGDRDALDALLRVELEIVKRRVAGKARNDLPPEFTASDVAQEAVLRLIKVAPAPRFDHPTALRAYLWKAAWHILLDHLAVRRPGSFDPNRSSAILGAARRLVVSGGFKAVDSRDERVALDVAIQLLRDADREILELVYGEGLTIEHAAERLSIAREAVKMRLVRARKNLAGKLRAWSEVVQ